MYPLAEPMSSPRIIEEVFDAVHTGRYFARLVGQPAPHRGRRPPELLYHATLNAVEPRFTVVTPMFNAAESVDDYLEATAAHATLPFDWIVIDDASDDGTGDRAKALLARNRHPAVARATIVRNPVPVFETACDNLGFTLADTEVIVEIQGDIQIQEAAYDALLIRAFATMPKPSSLSGRCGHSFLELRNRFARAMFGRGQDECVGLCGTLIERPESIDPLRGRLYRCDTVPRGPWVVLKSDLVRYGYLDERHFFLGNDDHDYHRRLLEAEGRRPLYVPMAIRSPLRLGATRRRRSGVNEEVFQALKAEKKGSPEFRRFLGQARSSVPQQVL